MVYLYSYKEKNITVMGLRFVIIGYLVIIGYPVIGSRVQLVKFDIIQLFFRSSIESL